MRGFNSRPRLHLINQAFGRRVVKSKNTSCHIWQRFPEVLVSHSFRLQAVNQRVIRVTAKHLCNDLLGR